MSRNTQPLLNLSLSHPGARIDDPAHYMRPSEGNPHSYHSQYKEDLLRPFFRLENNHHEGLLSQAPQSATTTGRGGRHPQVKQVRLLNL